MSSRTTTIKKKEKKKQRRAESKQNVSVADNCFWLRLAEGVEKDVGDGSEKTTTTTNVVVVDRSERYRMETKKTKLKKEIKGNRTWDMVNQNSLHVGKIKRNCLSTDLKEMNKLFIN